MNNFDNNNNNFDWYVGGQLRNGNKLKEAELQEKQAMRKAFCKANDIPFEEVEIPSMSENLTSGSLKVLLIILSLFIIGTTISVLITDNNFLNFLGWWF